MEIHYILLNFWHLSIFAFASLPKHWMTVVILSQHLSYLSGTIISWKIMSFKIKMKENFLLNGLSWMHFLLYKICVSVSLVSQIGRVSHMSHEIWLFSLQCSCQTSWGKFLEATFSRDSGFTHSYIRLSDSFLLKLHICCTGKQQNSQTF